MDVMVRTTSLYRGTHYSAYDFITDVSRYFYNPFLSLSNGMETECYIKISMSIPTIDLSYYYCFLYYGNRTQVRILDLKSDLKVRRTGKVRTVLI